jgi:ParB-like chromosome segregation protein Spo0J
MSGSKMFTTKQSEFKNSKQTKIKESTTALRIQTNKEYESLVLPMNKEIFESLLSSIRENGQLEPITINNNGEVLDGHHRLRACEKLHLEPISEVSLA